MAKEIIMDVAKRMNGAVMQVLGSTAIDGFEKAYTISQAIVTLNELLTPEYMKPIMAMQGNKLGFRTDKDKTGGYTEDVVKRCLIEAVLIGLQPYGNQFNIIAGNMYPTKEGCGAMLEKQEGLKYDIVCEIKALNKDKTSASVEASITWQLSGASRTRVIPIPIKIDSYASVDSIIGKATRKARAWLLSNITGIEITDGDVGEAIPIRGPIVLADVDKEFERLKVMIEDATDVEHLMNIDAAVKAHNSEELTAIYRQKSNELVPQ
jgi:hypothetical protein